MFMYCELIESKKNIDDIGEIYVYGLKIYEQFLLCEKTTIVEDISSNICNVTKLLKSINKNQVSRIHLYDVIYDYLVS